jgi:FAS-associated factor 2
MFRYSFETLSPSLLIAANEDKIAIAKFFDGEGPDPLAQPLPPQDIPRASARHENLHESLLSDSIRPLRGSQRQRTDPAPRIVPQGQVTGRSPWFIGLLLAPFGWGWRAASTVLRTLLYVFTFLPASIRPRAVTNTFSTGFRGTNGRRPLMPRDTAARFKREFDEEYGENELPFFEGGIAQAHDLAKKDLKFMLVVLMSPEHDDTESFVKDTLLCQEVVDFIKDPTNNIIVWGGNVLDSEAYQVATEYNCTKFPFSALVCLTPKEGSTRMGIVKRLVGPMPATTYLSEIRAGIEKYGADLDGVRAERTAQEVTRSLRTEQDSAYERSLAIDRERARQKREAAAAAAAAEKKAQEDAEAATRLEEKRQQWRAWRATKILPEPPTGDKNVVRVALKMPEESGIGRIIRRFPQDAPMEELYAFVECYDIIQEESEDESVETPDKYEHEFKFRIASIMPRMVYEPSGTVTMGEKIGRSGNLIVEDIAVESESESEDDDDDEDEEAEED